MKTLESKDQILAMIYRAIDENGYCEGDVTDDIADDIVDQVKLSEQDTDEAEKYLNNDFINNPDIDGCNVQEIGIYSAIHVIYENNRQKVCKLYKPTDIFNIIMRIRVENVFDEVLDDLFADGLMLQGKYIYMTKKNLKLIKKAVYDELKDNINAMKTFGFSSEEDLIYDFKQDNYDWLIKHDKELFE